MLEFDNFDCDGPKPEVTRKGERYTTIEKKPSCACKYLPVYVTLDCDSKLFKVWKFLLGVMLRS